MPLELARLLPSSRPAAAAKLLPVPTTWFVTNTQHRSETATCRNSRAVSATRTWPV